MIPGNGFARLDSSGHIHTLTRAHLIPSGPRQHLWDSGVKFPNAPSSPDPLLGLQCVRPSASWELRPSPAWISEAGGARNGGLARVAPSLGLHPAATPALSPALSKASCLGGHLPGPSLHQMPFPGVADVQCSRSEEYDSQGCPRVGTQGDHLRLHMQAQGANLSERCTSTCLLARLPPHFPGPPLTLRWQ